MLTALSKKFLLNGITVKCPSVVARRADHCGNVVRRYYRVSTNSQFTVESDPFAGLSPIDIEKELFKIKRKMGSQYSKGHYRDALESAVDLEEKVARYIGKDNAIYASCLNNVALMNKMMGNSDIAMAKYTEALHAYEDTVGKKHQSYISTLANIGVLFKALAQSSKGMEKVQLLERAEESLTDALRLRTELSGPDAKETLYSANHLATMYLLKNLNAQAELRLRETLERARKAHGDNDSVTATTLNNLGLVLKNQKKYDEAEKCYNEALHIRSCSLGDKHPDTIVSMHNLAELHTEQGKQKDANDLREQIISILGPNISEAEAVAISEGNSAGGSPTIDGNPSPIIKTAEGGSSPEVVKEALARAAAAVNSSTPPVGMSTEGLKLRKSAKEAVHDAVKEATISSGLKPSTRSRRKK